MRLAKLCITLAFALAGWHGALAAALCARHAACGATAAPRDPHAHQHQPQADGRETPGGAHATGEHVRIAARARVDHASEHGHCGPSAESGDAADARDAKTAAARGDDETVSPGGDKDASSEGDRNVSPGSGENASAESDENASPESVAVPGAPPCAHCVGRPATQPVSVNSVAPSFARDSHAAHAPARQFVAPAPPAARTRRAPPAHSPPRSRPLHLLNSALLI